MNESTILFFIICAIAGAALMIAALILEKLLPQSFMTKAIVTKEVQSEEGIQYSLAYQDHHKQRRESVSSLCPEGAGLRVGAEATIIYYSKRNKVYQTLEVLHSGGTSQTPDIYYRMMIGRWISNFMCAIGCAGAITSVTGCILHSSMNWV